MNVPSCRKTLRSHADPETARDALRFFKTGPGEYGEGDQFLGLRVPFLRQVVKEVEREASPANAEVFLKSEYHEERLFALFIWVRLFKKGNESVQKEIYNRYLANTKYINNWDLVDSSAYFIVGPYLEKRDRGILYELAKSNSLWERRIAVLSTLHFIRKHNFEDALKLSKLLIHDPEDLIHKATGWMLREVGNRNLDAETSFLNKHAPEMPRTMLRYAIEKFPKDQKTTYLNA
jgi:3-methyladenine DNA glycosylase AlkD